MKPLYIFDLDDTLALIDHRRHILDEPGRDDSKWRLCLMTETALSQCGAQPV